MQKKTRNFLLILLTVIVLSISAVVVAFASNVNDYAQTEITLKSEYMIGEIASVPEKTLSNGGNSAKANVIVHFPSGAAIESKAIPLTESGKYTVEYRAVINGRLIKEYEYFTVNDKLYSFSGSESSAVYGLDTSVYNTGRTALNVKLAQGETLTFNKIINLNEIDDHFITFYSTPAKPGVAEVNGLFITLTDVYDQTNVITFQYKLVPYLGASYVYSTDYVTAGHGTEVPRAYTLDGQTWRLRINDKFGTGTGFSFYGVGEKYGGYAVKDSFVQLGVDLQTKQAYISNQSTTKNMIIDMDNPLFFDNLWKGFTTGEVRVSIKGYEYSGATCNLNIMEIGGYDFNNNKVSDEEKPVITIDSAGYDLDKLPNGNLGKSYPVFNASAFDKGDGVVDVSVRAYYNFDSQTPVEINIKDGVIKTDRMGKYKFVYTATDKYDNVAMEEVAFFVQGEVCQMSVEIGQGHQTSVDVGRAIAVADYNVIGGAGDRKVELTFDKKCTYNAETGMVIPFEVGPLKVTYTATDMTGHSVSNDYVITVNECEIPIVLNNVTVPDYLIGGMKYQFPTIYADKFVGATVTQIKADVYVDGTLVENGLYLAEDKAGFNGKEEDHEILADSYTIEAVYKIGDVIVYSKTITVLDVRYKLNGMFTRYDISRYFVSDSFMINTDKSGINFSIENAVSSTAKIEYAKPFLYDNANVRICLNSIDADSISMVLTDYENQNNKLKIEYVKDKSSGSTSLYLNDVDTGYDITVGGFFDNQNGFIFGVQDGIIVDGASLKYDVSNMFSAQKVKMQINFNGVAVGSDLSATISTVSAILINSDIDNDNIAPFAKIIGEYAVNAEKNDVLTIHPIIFEDTFDTFVNATVTVSIVSETAGNIVLLENADATVAHQVTLSNYGVCNIKYSVVDGKDNPREPIYKINIANKEGPVITLDGSVPTSLKVGQKYTFATATAYSMVDGQVDVKYFVVNPTNNPIMLKNRTFTPTVVGTHAFRVFAMDSFGNITIKDVRFEVVK